MNLKHMFSTLVMAGILLSLALTGCSDSASASAPPQQVVEEFYRWHMSYPGNPLVDRAYRDSDYLADSFVQEVDELLDSFDKGGYDPFLLAQDIPVKITVDDAVIEDDVATVLTHQEFGGNPDLRPIEVELAFVGGEWKITGVRMPEMTSNPVTFSPEARLELADKLGVDPQELGVEPLEDGYLVNLTPRGVVQAFYSWYLGYIGEPGSESMRNPLVDRAYRDSGYLAKSFVKEVDELLDGFDRGGFDPFLLAQDIPAITAGEGLITGDTATVVTQQHYAGNPEAREIQVELAFVDGVWQITGIMAPSLAGSQPVMAPAQVVEGFYSWYLAYIGDPASETFRNPMVDRAYRGHELLTDRFVRQVDELLDSFEHGGYDPFLCAQDIPQELTAREIVLDGATVEVEVTTSFFGHHFRVDLVDQDGTWKIDDIRCTSASAQ
jgi:hypothetical protein